MKFIITTLFRITPLIMLIAWLFGGDEFYDFLIFIAFAIFSHIFIFKLLIHLLLKKPLKNSIISLFCLFVYFFMLFDFEITKLRGLIEIERNMILFQAGCLNISCESNTSCEKLDGKWFFVSNGIMTSHVRGIGTNLKVYYVIGKNRYELKTNPFFPFRTFFQFKCP